MGCISPCSCRILLGLQSSLTLTSEGRVPTTELSAPATARSSGDCRNAGATSLLASGFRQLVTKSEAGGDKSSVTLTTQQNLQFYFFTVLFALIELIDCFALTAHTRPVKLNCMQAKTESLYRACSASSNPQPLNFRSSTVTQISSLKL